MKIFICTNSFDENSGGPIVLHRLCHIINKYSEHQAYLIGMQPIFYGKLTLKKMMSQIKWMVFNKFRFQIKAEWKTPIWNSPEYPDDAIVIYPEIVNGNPLKIRNVVRWFLHQPGFHTNKIDYSSGEIYFKFNNAIKDFTYPGSITSESELKVIYYPTEIYFNDNRKRDIECCFLVRKGGNKNKEHPDNAVNIDNLTHYQTAEILRRSKMFICYDDYTAYSIFAVLCGCPSYVVPGPGQTLESWYPDESDRYGISYGFSEEQKIWMENTKSYVFEHIEKQHKLSIDKILHCLNVIEKQFE